MAFVSWRWPFINPSTIDALSVGWWNYYVRNAKALVNHKP